MTSFIAELKKRLPESDWPVVVVALRNESQSWTELEDGDFAAQALSAAASDRAKWSPAFLGLLRLGQSGQFAALRETPMQPVAEKLRYEAAAAYEKLAKQAEPALANPDLAQATLLALALRERRRMLSSWEQLGNDLSIESADFWKLPLACLLGLIPNQHELLQYLLAPEQSGELHQLALHALVSNPLTLDVQTSHLTEIAAGYELPQLMSLLRSLASAHPQLAQHLAMQALEDLKEADTVSGENLTEIQRLLLQAEIYQISGHAERANPILQAAWEAAQRLQADLAAKVAEANGDEAVMLAAVRESAELANPKMVAAAKAGTKRPGALLSAARIAMNGEDAGEAKDLAIAALKAATKETRAEETREKVKLLCELGDLFMDLELPAEAEQAAKAAANMQGNSAESTALLSRILLSSAKSAEALQEAHLAVALDPENVAVRRTLAQALELNGQVDEAFNEWMAVAGQTAEPAVDDLLALASSAFRSGHIMETIAACQQVLAGEPANAAAYALMGQAVAAQGDDESAISYLQRATELGPAQLQPWLSLAELQLAKGSNADALATLLSAQKYSEPSAKVHALIAGIYEGEARTEEANAAYLKATELAAEQAATDIAQDVALKHSALLERLGRTQPALDILEHAQISFPENAEIARLLGHLLLQVGDAKRALAFLKMAATVAPNDLTLLREVAHAHTAIGEHDAAEDVLAAIFAGGEESHEVRIELAEAMAAQGKHAEALQHFESGLKGNLANEPTWNKRISLAKAASFSASGKPVAALHTLEALDEQQPSDLDILRALCEAYKRAGRADEAAEIAEKVFHGDATNEDTLLWYAETMQALDKSAVASKALRKTNGASLSPRVALALGKIQWTGDSPKSAMATFEALLQSEEAYNIAEAGSFLLKQGAASESIPYYKRALEMAGASQPILDGLTSAYLRLEQFEDALEAIEESLQLAPNKAANLEIKAEILQRLGKPQGALQAVDKALELVPNDAALLSRKTALLRQSEDWAGAMASAFSALAQDPGHLTNLQTAAELAVLGLQPEMARTAIADANITGIMSPGLATLHAELTLDAGEEIAAAKIFAAALEDLEGDPRVLALQSRLALCRGDRGQAAQLLAEALDAYKTHTEPLTSLEIGKAAEGLNQWDTAIELYSELAEAHPSLVAAQFHLGRAITLRAEWQQVCEASVATRDLPGAAALAKQARAAALRALNAALEAGAEAEVRALISGWLKRAELRFGETDLESLPAGYPANASEAAALAFAMRMQNEIAGDAISGYEASPEVLLERALAGEKELMAKAAVGLPHSAPVQALAAQFAQRAGKPAEALGLIQRALALWPGQPRWQALAGELQEQLGNLAEAADHFRMAAELQPEESKHYYALGRNQLAGKNVADAIGSLQKATELKPETSDYLITLAQAHRQGGDSKQAKAVAEQALRAAPGNTAAMLMQAELALEEKDGAKAKELAQQALTVTPKDAPALRAFAEALHLLGESDEAIAVLDRARTTADDEVPLLIRRAELQTGEAGLRSLIKLSQKYPERPEVFFALSERLAQNGDTQDAIQAAQHAVKKADALPEDKRTALHLHLARLLKQSGNLDQSLHHLDQAAAIQPTLADSHLERGRVFIARRQYRPALEAFRQAAQLAPSAPEPHYEAGLALKEAKDYSAAESELRQAAHLAPKDRNIHRQLATVIALNLVHRQQEAGVAL